MLRRDERIHERAPADHARLEFVVPLGEIVDGGVHAAVARELPVGHGFAPRSVRRLLVGHGAPRYDVARIGHVPRVVHAERLEV